MKKILQNLFNFFGYSLIKKKNFEKLYRTLDQSIKYLIKKDNPIIFDVGAHTGETIERFRKLYNKSIIHSFEPQVDSFQKLKKFSDDKTILNNFALGEKIEIKKFYINKNDSTSGFYKFTDKMFADHNNYSKDIQIKTLDQYVEERNVENIDILKIDVQGYEDNVLKGAIKTLTNKIKILELEIIFIDYYEKKSSFYNLESIIKPLGFELYTISSPVLDESDDRLKWLDAIYISNKFFK
jgi:FkbM family methyltransferase